MKLSNYNITICYGDSLNFIFKTDKYQFTPEDTLTMTIKAEPCQCSPTLMLIECTDFSNEGAHINIRKEEMKLLPVGEYFYDMVVENAHIKWTLLEKPKKLIITEVLHDVL